MPEIVQLHTRPGVPASVGTFGAHHIAYPCWNPAETVRLYRDVLGFSMPHAITAKGWGPADHPDFVHFFFDVGNGNLLAFFSYLGWEKPAERHPVIEKASHLAFTVPNETIMLAVKDRLIAAGYELHFDKPIKHEMIESIYLIDPNGLMIEFTYNMRPFSQIDDDDARRTMDALIATLAAGQPSIESLWRIKAGAFENEIATRAAVFVVDVPEYQPLIEWAGEKEGLSVVAAGGYQVIASPEPIEVTRREVGLRAALWFSLATGGIEGRITRFDWNIFRLEPKNERTGS